MGYGAGAVTKQGAHALRAVINRSHRQARQRQQTIWTAVEIRFAPPTPKAAPGRFSTMRQYNTACQHCGGLIAEPNKPYGYAGAFCHCEGMWALDGERFIPSRQAEIDELRRRLARLEADERREQEQAWRQYQVERYTALTNAELDAASPNRLSLNA